MEKITFIDNVTKANADTFNTMQDNIEDAINEVSTDLTDEINNTIEYIDEKNTYSTDEIQIGTWINGKPLYRIALESTTYATTYNIPASNVDKITKVSGMIKRSDYNIWQFLPSRLDNANFSAQFGNFQLDTNRIVANVSFGTSWSSAMSRIIIIIEYTKTTD